MEWISRHWRILAVFVFMTLLLSQIPARAISRVLPDNVTLTGVSGTIWSGRAGKGLGCDRSAATDAWSSAMATTTLANTGGGTAIAIKRLGAAGAARTIGLSARRIDSAPRRFVYH
jgi:hypothetical protein